MAFLTRIFGLFGKSAERHLKRGEEASERGDGDLAIACFTEAIRLDPQMIDAYVRRGIVHFEMGDYDNAIADFSEIIRLDPDEHAAYYERGFAHLRKGDDESAIRDFTKRLEFEPGFPCAYCYRAFAIEERGDHEAAARDYAEALQLDPEHAKEHLGRAFESGDRGLTQEEIRELTIALRLDPGLALAYVLRANVSIDQGRIDQAIEDCNEAIRLQPENEVASLAYGVRGRAGREKGEYDGAIADCTEAIRLNSQNTEPYIERGSVHLQGGELDKAIADFTTVIQLDPTCARAYSWRAAASRATPNRAQAADDERKALELSGFGRSGKVKIPDNDELAPPVRLTTSSELVADVRHLGVGLQSVEGAQGDWSSDGQQVAFLKSHLTPGWWDRGEATTVFSMLVAELWIVRVDGSTPRRLTYCVGCRSVYETAWATDPRWAPDGKSLAYLSGQMAGGRLVLIDGTTGEPRELDYFATSMRWSPDSRCLSFVGCEQEVSSRPDRQLCVAVLDVDGQTLREIAEVPNAEVGDWSPNGRQLLYTTWESSASHMEWTNASPGGPRRVQGDLWVAYLDGSAPRRLATNVAGSGVWSPDGEWIAYRRDSTEPPGLWRTKFATEERERLVEKPVRSAQWVGDGAILAYVRQGRRKRADVYLLHVSDGQERQVTTSGNVVEAQVSSDGGHAVVIVMKQTRTDVRCDSYLLRLERDALEISR